MKSIGLLDHFLMELEGVKRHFLRPKSQEFILRHVLLVLIFVLAFSIRLISVLKYESVIHEFDPYFNYRSTIMLIKNGVYEFWNWFDWESWHPLGRVVGGTVYPGLMMTAAAMYRISEFITAHISLRDICVFTGPFFSGLTVMVAYNFGKLVRNTETGLMAALLMSIVPGYISRSVAGSFDNEAVSIFALLFSFYLWCRAVKLGTISASAAAAFGYFYMAASWGAYVFISNLIALYVIVMVISGRYSRRLYVAYSTFWALGSILAMQVRFISSNHIMSTELLSFNSIFLAMQAWEVLCFLYHRIGLVLFERFVLLIASSVAAIIGLGLTAMIATGRLNPWTGRFWTLLDPTYASKFIPIVASVSEHQPTTWANYAFDLHILSFAAPAGIYFCFKDVSDISIFLITFGLSAAYFSGIMVRLMLVAAPAFVMLSAVSLSSIISSYCSDIYLARATIAKLEGSGGNTGGGSGMLSSNGVASSSAASATAAAAATSNPQSKRGGGGSRKNAAAAAAAAAASTSSPKATMYSAWGVILGAIICLLSYSQHCIWLTKSAYSSPSIVLVAGWGPYRHIMDDFREAYYWLSHNTATDAKIMSWWDYGYQITAMGNRSVIVDNNTWNTTHIATVGRAMSSNETEAYKISKMLDADYVLVIFGGLSAYSGDDINKFLWMVRIGGGVFPWIKEPDYLSASGMYTVGSDASDTMLDSLMYKLSYHDFQNVVTQQGKPGGYDRVRNYEMGRKDFTIENFEEAFTSENWIVRIFKVKDLENRKGHYDLEVKLK